MKREWKKTIGLSMIFVLMTGLVLWQLMGEHGAEVAALLAKLEPKTIGMLCICSLGYMAVEGMGLTVLAKSQKETFTFRNGIMAGFYMGAVRAPSFGMATAPALVYDLTRQGLPVEWSAGMASINYGLHKTAVAAVAGIGFFCYGAQVQAVFGESTVYLWIGYGVTVLIVAGLFALCLWQRGHRLLLAFLRRLPRRKIQKAADELEERLGRLSSQTRTLLKNKTAVGLAFFFACLKVLFWYVMPYLALCSMQEGRPFSLGEGIAFTALTMALAGVIPTPGGVASVEVIFTMLFSPLVGEPMALALLLAYRFFSYYASCFLAWGTLLAAVGWQKWRLGRGHGQGGRK